MSERACSLHILCVSDSRYTSPPDEAQRAKETDIMLTEVVRSYQLVRMWLCALCQAGCDHSKACLSRRGHQYSRKYIDLVVPGFEPLTSR